jgi:hypothetical protein
MAFDNSIIPEEIQGSYFQDPSLSIPTGTDIGLLNLVYPSLPMQQVQEDPIKNSLDLFESRPASASTMAMPTYFDYEASQADRYVNSKNYGQLGFDPALGQQNEYKYGALQTWGDVWKNGLTGMFKLAGSTYIEGWKGWGNLIDAIASTSWNEAKQDLIGTPEELMAADKATKDILNKYAIFSTPESEEGIFNRKFFGDMLQQSGFAVGTIGQFLSEELLTMGLSTEFSLTKLGLKAPTWAGKIVTKADVAADMVKLGNPIWKSRSISEGMVQGARQLIPYADSVYTMSKYGKAGAGALQIAAIGLGGLRRTLAEANMAFTEARMETASTYGELYTKLYNEELNRTGQAPSADTLENIKKTAMDAAQDNFKINSGILMLSNRLQFDNLFSKFGVGRGVFGTVGEYADDVLKVTGRKTGQEAIENATKVYAKGKLGTLGLLGDISKDFGKRTAAWEATKSLGKNIFKWETSEGLQELLQEGSNIALTDYYYDLYHGVKGANFTSYIEKAASEQYSNQGLKTFLMGALTGRLLSPINFVTGQAKYYGGSTQAQRQAREKGIAESVAVINAFYKNPNLFLNEHIANVKVQDKAAKNMEEAIKNRDKYEYSNNKDGAFAKLMSTAMKTDMFKAITDTIREYGQNLNDTDFKEAFGIDRTEENVSSVKDFFDKIADETEAFEKTWKNLRDKYGDSVLVDIYREGSPERETALLAKKVLDDAIEILATNNYRATRNAQRATSIQNEVAAIPVFGSSAAAGFRVVGVIENTKKEIDLLKNEIASMESIEKPDKAAKDLLKVKKQQLKALMLWNENYASLEKQGMNEKRKFKKALTAFAAYMTSKNAESGISQELKVDDVQDIYEKLLDYIQLNKDSKDYIDAYNILANPINFVNTHRRLIDAVTKTAEKFKEEHLEEIKEGKIIKKEGEGDKKPKHTVKLEENGTYSVISPEGNIVAKDIKTEDEANQIAAEMDAVLAQGGDIPTGLGKNRKVIESRNNVYLIEGKDDDGNLFYYIVNKNNDPVTDVVLDGKKYPNYTNPADLYDSLEIAKEIFEAVANEKADDFAEYSFDGKKIKFGSILVDEKGRKFKVLTKKTPVNIKGVPKIVIQPVSGVTSTYTIQSLAGYRLETDFEKASKPENPNAMRLVRNNELVRIYPKRMSKDESLEDAKQRLKKLIHDTPKDQLVRGISIRITKNTDLSPVAILQEGTPEENRHLQINPETHMVEILYNNETIGFATYYGIYMYLNDEGKRTSLDSITKEQFLQIFDPGSKDVSTEFNKFKENYKQSREFFSSLISKLGGEETATLTTDEVSKLFTITPSVGEYDFAKPTDPVISLNDLDYSTIEGETYILDRRTRYLGNGFYEEDPRVQASAGVIGEKAERIEEKVKAARFEGGLDKLRNYGRYVAVVELPNGSIKFVELTASAFEKAEMDDLVDRINTLSKELKENNLEERTDPKTKKTYKAARNTTASDSLNSEINKNIYITVPGKRGMRVNLLVTPTGDIKMEFATFTKGSKVPMKSEIYLKESTDDTKPLNIKDSTELLRRINDVIRDHDGNSRNVLKQIGNFSLSIKNFKRSLSEDDSVDEYRKMISGVNKDVVKNEGIFFSIKKNETSPSSVIITTVPKKEGKGSTEEEGGIEISAEEIARNEELLRKLKEQQQKQSVQDRIQELSLKKREIIQTIQAELEGAGTSVSDIMRLMRSDKGPFKEDARIKEIDQELAGLNGSGTAFKVAKNLSEQDVADINEFTDWVARTLPVFISTEELKNINRTMKKEGITVGMFYMQVDTLSQNIQGKIAVGKKTPYKYHEAFHSVFRMLLTDDQITSFYNTAKQELRKAGKDIEVLKKELFDTKPEVYSKLTEKQLEERVYEEYMADMFDEWKKNNKVETAPQNKSLFRRILDFIMNLFKARSTSPLEELFMNIEKGKYKNSNVISNRFTQGVKAGVTEEALKAIITGYTVIDNEYGERERIPIYLSQEEGNILASTIAALYHKRMTEAGLRKHSDDILDGVFADYYQLYNLNTNEYYNSDAFLDRFDGSALALYNAEEQIKRRFNLFSDPDLLQELKKSVLEHTKIMGYRSELENDLYDDYVDEYGDRVTTDNWKETYSIGGYGSLSQELREYLGTIVEEKTDEFGNTQFLNGQPIIEAANANVLYEGILKAVSGSVTEEQVIERLQTFAQYNPEARKFWNKFSGDVGLVFDEDGRFVDISNKQQANLFQAVVKGFSKFQVDYYFVNKDINKGESRIMEANRRGAAKNQFSIWYNAFLRKFVDEYEVVPKSASDLASFFSKKTSALRDLATILKKGNVYSESEIDDKLEKIVTSLRNELGISLSPLFLKFSYLSSIDPQLIKSEDNNRILRAFEGVDPMTEEDAREISTSIASGKNPFGTNIDPDKIAESDELTKDITSLDEAMAEAMADSILGEGEEEDSQQEEKEVKDDVDSTIGRLTALAAANAIFDEQVTTSSFKNAEGEIVYSHQLPTFNLVRGAELQNKDFRDELKKDKFLETNFLLNNKFFNHIAATFKISRADGIKDSSLKKNDKGENVEDKRLNVNQNEGVTYGSMSDREFMIMLFELYGNNKKYSIENERGGFETFMTASTLLGVLEASNTGDIVNLPVIRSVEYVRGKISLTTEMKNALLAEVKREYDRISRVEDEIQNGYPNGVIEGYHTGQRRGLEFIKMGNMLGETLSKTLQEAARNNEDISTFETDIFLQIEKYWLGPGGKLDQMVASLEKQDIIKRVPERDTDGNIKKDDAGNEKTILVNRLLNKFIFRGFDSNGKKDTERNSKLNIIPNAVEYNIAQVMMSNFLNTLSARQLFIGDAAENFKNDGGIDEVKRNRGLNGSGASIYSMITAPLLGISHTNKTSHVITFKDPLYKGKFAGKDKEKADAQMYMTVKGLRYTLFGLGKLNAAQAELLDKIEKGQSVSIDDIFGEKYRGTDGKTRRRGGSIEFNAQTNSIKLIYSDGKKYIKTSGVILSKEYTSMRTRSGKFVSRPGMEELHKLRQNLEEFENTKQTITFGIPQSASKGRKENIVGSVDEMRTSDGKLKDNSFIEYDNRFWRLQLENPSNKVVITDPTQAKQLIISEQSENLVVNFRGEDMKLGDVINNYLSNTEQRVKNNYFSARDEMFDIKKAFGELGKSLDQEAITPKLGKFLQRAVSTLAATGSDSQLVEFFTPIFNEKTGEYTPKYDLNHPITLDKFTQLFLAYYSKGVMSEKVPGHTLSLMSNWGSLIVKRVLEIDEQTGQPKRWEVIRRDQYKATETEGQLQIGKDKIIPKRWINSMDRTFENLEVGDIYLDDLRHNVPEYNEKGEIIGYFTEYMTAPHYAEDMGISPDEKLPEALLRAFGVRIPSDDKHSFVSARLVDFLPAYYGSTAVFPHELIEISGADFDIDKVYMQILDTYIKNGKRVPYGTAKTKEDKFVEYVLYLRNNDKNFKAKVKELQKLGVSDENVWGDIQGYLNPTHTYDDIEELIEDFNRKGTGRTVAQRDRNALEPLILKSALMELGLPTTSDEYAEFKNKNGEQNNGLLNNLILDAKIKLLNNDGMVQQEGDEIAKAFQVVDVQPLLDVLEVFKQKFPILSDIFNEAGEDVDSMMGQYKAFKNNKEGARNIGPAVNAMLVYALLSRYGIKVRESNSKGDELYVLEIDGHKFNSYEHSREYNSKTDQYDGKRMFFHISAIVNAMTDNAKERLAARLGLNINAVGVVSNMVALGVPFETALMFNLQPSVREFYNKIAITSKNIKTAEEQKMFKSKIGKEMLEKLLKDLPENFVAPKITTELLENNIKSAGTNKEADYAILDSFLKFYQQTEYYSSVAQVIKLAKGLGTSNEEIDKIDQKEEMLGLNLDNAEFAESFIPFDLRQMLTGVNKNAPHHNITANYIRIKNQIKDLQKSIFIEKTYLFNRIKDTVLANLTVNTKEKESFNKTLKRDIITYLGIKSYMNYLKKNGKGAKLAGLDNAMIYEASAVQRGEGFKDIIDTVKDIRLALPNNYFAHKFLNMIPVALKDVNSSKEFINPNTKGGINMVESNTWAALGAFEQSKLEDSFLEIYSNPKTRPLANNLFNYLIVKDGGQFRSGSFIKFIPPAMFKELLDATGASHQLLKLDKMVGNDTAYNEIFGASAKDIYNEFTKLYTTNVNNAFNVKILPSASQASKNVTVEKPKGYVPEVVKTNKSETTPIPTKVVIDVFGGIRKKEMMLLTDEMGNEFYAEATAVGKFTPDELEKLDYNKALLKELGINIVNRPNEQGENRYYLSLPYTLKINTGTINQPSYTFYKLKEIARDKEKISGDKGIGAMMLEVGDNTILTSYGTYEKFEPEGSRKQWKAGGVTGEMPSNIVLRKRTAKNSINFDMIDTLESQIEKLESQLKGVSGLQLEAPVQELRKDWGIYVRMVGNKIDYYKLDEKKKEVPYDPGTTKAPKDLLDRLNKEYEESGGKAGGPEKLTSIFEETSAPEIPFIPEGGPSVGNISVPEEQKANAEAIKKLMMEKLASKNIKSELDQQKEQDDNSCPL